MQPIILIIASLTILGSGLFVADETAPARERQAPAENEQTAASTTDATPPAVSTGQATSTPAQATSTTAAATTSTSTSGDTEQNGTTTGATPAEDAVLVATLPSSAQLEGTRDERPQQEVTSLPRENTLQGAQEANEGAGEPGAPLSIDAIIAQTNRERERRGQAPLKANPQLREMAHAKLNDIFDQDYLDHVSPDGVGIDTLAATYGYRFSLLGENLAWGNFQDVEQLVDAWMASEGHRRNILTSQYEHIGVAVREGQLQGRDNWVVVQLFGAPQATCTPPNAALEQQIAARAQELAALQQQIAAQRQSLTAQTEGGAAYNAAVAAFNERVRAYNALLAQHENAVTTYNQRVRTYNTCIGA